MTDPTRLNSPRICKKCGDKIIVGKDKLGRSVFPGGICYSCWKNPAKKVKP